MDDRIDCIDERQTVVCTCCGRNSTVTDKFCCWCGASLAQNTPAKTSGNKKSVKAVWVTLPVMIIALAVFFSCICLHEWVDATCERPRYCSKCEATEGEALGHDWAEATCTVAQYCKVCSMVQGTPLGHTPSEEVRQLDAANGNYIIQQHCTTCRQQLTAQQVKLETFVENAQFFFSAQDFLDRMSAIAQEAFPDFHYEFATEQDSFMVHLFLTNTAGVDGTLMFLTEDNKAISQENIAVPGIWCLSLTDVGSAEKYGGILSGEIIQLLYLTCDPLLSEEDLTRFIAFKLTSALNSAEGASIFGYMEQNELLYEFGHLIYENLAIENIQVYAADWRQQ